MRRILFVTGRTALLMFLGAGSLAGVGLGLSWVSSGTQQNPCLPPARHHLAPMLHGMWRLKSSPALPMSPQGQSCSLSSVKDPCVQEIRAHGVRRTSTHGWKLTHVLTTAPPRDADYRHPHFAEKETEAQRGWGSSQLCLTRGPSSWSLPNVSAVTFTK